MKSSLQKWHAYALGFAAGLFLFAVGREVCWAVGRQGIGVVVSEALSAVGSLRWIDSTLITGIAAVTAAFVSIRAVRDQIKASDEAVRRQIEHATMIERARTDARRDACRAVLPLALSAINEMIELNAPKILTLLDSCVEEALLRDVEIPNFAQIPPEVISSLKDIVQTLDKVDRPFFVALFTAMQVDAATLRDLKRHRLIQRIVTASNLKAIIVRQAEIYARAGALYGYGRGDTEEIPTALIRRQLGNALFHMQIPDNLRDELIERYDLDVEKVWPFPARQRS